ncbi:MAG TPA: diguanylate cyclase [Verrucomicrobiae bacterium]|nr:diguanylate cyclase [Verrucomicrobiae bacterium]
MDTTRTATNQNPSSDAAAEAPSASNQQASGPRHSTIVLVVDDSPVARKLVEHALDKDQYTMISATTGAQALELFAEHKPGIVITDWLMPDLSGLQLCERLRTDAGGRFTYIILLTGVSEKSKVVKGLQAGADDYMTKPFNAEELSARVNAGRRIVELHREIEAKNLILQQLALTDSLTNLPNRRAIEEWGRRQLTGALRHKFPFWIVMVDVDQFKQVNDTFGHDAGDAVLQGVADIIRRNTRQSDICGRIGGDEFMLIMTFSDQDGIRTAVERIRQQIEAHPFNFRGRESRITASIGVAGIRQNQDIDLGRLMVQADVALYSAKRLGRNRAEVAATTTHVGTPPTGPATGQP